jgi:hypothetical protein
MKKIIFTVLILFSQSFSLFPQRLVWEKTIDFGAADAFLFSLKTDSEGCFVFTGRLDTTRIIPPYGLETKAITMKLDPNGEILWLRSVPGDYVKGAIGAGITLANSNSGYVITGGFMHSHGFMQETYPSLLLYKYDLDGNVVWNKIYTDVNRKLWGVSIDKTSEGGFIVAGTCDSCLYLMRTDRNGDSLWTKTYCNFKIMYDDFARPSFKIIYTSDLGYILCRTSQNSIQPQKMQVIKFNQDGDTNWSREYNTGAYSLGSSIIQTSDGNYLACGLQAISEIACYQDAKIIKIDQDGNLIWEKEYDKFGCTDSFSAIKEVSPDEFIAAGVTTNDANSDMTFAYVVKINAYGDTIWTKTDGEGSYGWLAEHIRDLDIASGYGILLGGNIATHLFFANLDQYGNGFVDIRKPDLTTENEIDIEIINNEILIGNKSSGKWQLNYLIIDEFGQTVYSNNILTDGTSRIDISKLESGIYIIRARDGSRLKVMKFTVWH